jgi:DNA-directed RNA polymerase subunit H (RpoH/RPB5)
MNYSAEIANSVRVIFEMLMDRGISEDKLTPLLNVSEKTTHDSRFVITLPDAEIGILFDINAKFSFKEVCELAQDVDENITSIIYVFKAPLNSAEIKKVNNLKRKKEIFSLLELQFNKTKHFLVPKHELINDPKEVDRIVEQHCLKLKTQFPHILKSDPMCKYLNGCSGDIIRVFRVSPTSATTIVYRVVI